MLSKVSFARHARHALARSRIAEPAQRRTFAAASSTGAYETASVSGLKIASRDAHGPTTKLAVVAKGGTRFQPLPGLSIGLEEFAFKNTARRSALRINREVELLGGQLSVTHGREALIIQASFLRDDLPYFAELLGEVVSQTKYTTHEFHEEVERTLQLKQVATTNDVVALALDNTHAAAFHSGIGASTLSTSSTPLGKYLKDEYIARFADVVYSKPNLAVVADGASSESLSKWVGQFFESVPATAPSGQSLETQATKYHGGEQRLSSKAGNAMVIAFPGSSYTEAKPEIAVLAALLGGQSTIKWAPGYSLLSKAIYGETGLSAASSSISYSDAGLLTVQLSGSAATVRKAAQETVTALQSIASGSATKEEVTKAVANAKFNALDAASLSGPSLHLAGSALVTTGKPFDLTALASAIEGVTADKLKTTAKTLLEGRATVSSVGDLFILPYAEEIGLKV